MTDYGALLWDHVTLRCRRLPKGGIPGGVVFDPFALEDDFQPALRSRALGARDFAASCRMSTGPAMRSRARNHLSTLELA
jgi:hypothetical protein